jgi:ubiquitin-conjugating enzyme E2 Z
MHHTKSGSASSATTAAEPTDIPISKESIHRILSDVRELMSCPIHDNGVYYVHDEEDILVGYAMLHGQAGTLYDGGYYFFRIKFPPDYPHTPLSATFLTNDGGTRMHPNFYKNGYVCLSILNNWRGEQWTGCLTLKSVLLTMASIMDDAPLLHEPGIRETHADFVPYHRIIEYKTIEFAMCALLNDADFDDYVKIPAASKAYFYPLMKKLFSARRDNVVDRVSAMCEKYGIGSVKPNYMVVSVYSMTYALNYEELMDKVKRVKCVQ